jgi:hypothetical protein
MSCSRRLLSELIFLGKFLVVFRYYFNILLYTANMTKRCLKRFRDAVYCYWEPGAGQGERKIERAEAFLLKLVIVITIYFLCKNV